MSRSRIAVQRRACAAAFTFLTRLPVGRIIAHDADDLGRSLVYFPVVGLVVGLAGAAVFAGALVFWPPILALLLSAGFTVLLTGAFHEDALADAFDGFGGGWNAQQVLEIMKDSRVGSYALVGVCFVLAAKMTALLAIADDSTRAGSAPLDAVLDVAGALVAAHVLGRWSSVVLISRLPYVRAATDETRRPTGLSFSSQATTSRLGAATVIAAAIVIVAIGWRALGAALAAGAIIWSGAVYLRRRIGGITGDALGAVNQFVELATYLTLAARL